MAKIKNIPTSISDIQSGDWTGVDATIKFRELIFSLIKTDVPVLEIGSSSIGKSYSLREYMDENGLEGQFLFVGTEKAEFIEGIPNLRNIKEGENQKFEYLRPYWFPNKEEIRERLKNGLEILKADFKDEYEMSITSAGRLDLFKKKLRQFVRTEVKKVTSEKKKKESKYIYADCLYYINWVEGYGNFWLVLDEIDKVEKMDKDKYAPLLHIVRERELKGWKLSGLREYPEYDFKFVAVMTERFKKAEKILDNNEIDLTDTRIIAIANDLSELQNSSPALYRRFVKVIITQSLYLEKKDVKTPEFKMTGENANFAKLYDVTRRRIHDCIVNTEVKQGSEKQKFTINELMAEIDETKRGLPLDEMNLQWTLGFIPELIFPGIPAAESSPYLPNAICNDWVESNDYKNTLLFRIIQDNFVPKYYLPLMGCINNIIQPDEGMSKKDEIQITVDAIYSKGNIVDFNNPSNSSVDIILDEYKQALNNREIELEGALDIQKGKAVTKAGTEATKGDVRKITNLSLIGVGLIEKSLIDNKPTKLTDMLMSSVPLLQNQFLCNSPYVSAELAKQQAKNINNSFVDMVSKLYGKNITDESSLETAMKEFIASGLGADEPYIYKYGIGFSKDEIVELSQSLTDDYDANVSIVRDRIKEFKPSIVSEELVSVLDSEDKIYYYEQSATYNLLLKEIYSVLPSVGGAILKEYKSIKNDAAKLNKFKKEYLDYYSKHFPYLMKKLFVGGTALIKDSEDDKLEKYVETKADESIAKTNYTKIDYVLNT